MASILVEFSGSPGIPSNFVSLGPRKLSPNLLVEVPEPALALLSGMDVGSGKRLLALALLSGMDVGSSEWQLATSLLSRMDVGSSEWLLASA